MKFINIFIISLLFFSVLLDKNKIKFNFFDCKNEKQISKNLTWKCIDKGGDMENGFVTICYSTNNIYESYIQLKQKYFEDGKLLLKKLPSKEIKYTSNNVNISYKLLNPKSFLIVLEYPGGDTEIKIFEKNSKTTIIKTMFPD